MSRPDSSSSPVRSRPRLLASRATDRPATVPATAGAPPEPLVTDTRRPTRTTVAPAVAELDTIVSLVEAARVHLPVARDLRRHQRGVGLRAARRRAQEQRQARLVAGDGPGARRHRRARRRDPHAPPGVGDLRPRRLVQRPAGRMPDRPPALPARRAARRRGPVGDRPARTRRSSSGSGCAAPTTAARSRAPRRFNLMFKTFMGPVEEDASVIYLRPETAQGSYVNFKNVQQSSRKKLPFGIAQIGKSFRNEISPGNFVFRMREFEQMEMQYFVRPEAEAAAAFEEWLPARRAWYERYGVAPARLRLREHAPDELAHYAKKAVDVEYRFPFGWKELEGVHNRGDFDLSRHSEASRREARVLRPGDRRARHPVGRRDGRRRGPGRLHVPDRRLPRGGGPRRDPGLARAPSRPRAVQGGRPAAAQEAARDRRAVPPHQGRPASATRWRSTTTRPRSASCTGARTRSARRGA